MLITFTAEKTFHPEAIREAGLEIGATSSFQADSAEMVSFPS